MAGGGLPRTAEAWLGVLQDARLVLSALPQGSDEYWRHVRVMSRVFARWDAASRTAYARAAEAPAAEAPATVDDCGKK